MEAWCIPSGIWSVTKDGNYGCFPYDFEIVVMQCEQLLTGFVCICGAIEDGFMQNPVYHICLG